ncbi:MAG: tetratricopeptide repeat protein [Burkholderiaceae bacterium]|nr:tetratricopeptide repeat protein [Sulfuritalea sp.]MCF8176453.1 tetratricopeptide repeat protein [Burkholderiaceae bacterium]
MKFLPIVLVQVLALTSACSTAQAPPVAPAPTSAPAPAPAPAPIAAPAATDRLPKQELTGQILYQFLLAEIAAQRGQFGLSASAYLELATSTRDPRIVRRAAEIAFHARQYDAALEAARLWQSLEPESPQAKQMLATLLLASGRLEELAASLVRDLAAEAPQNVGSALIKIVRAFTRYPDKSAVRSLLDRVTEPYLNLAEAHFVRAQAAHGVGDTESAQREIDRALELRPNWELVALFKADLLPKGAAQTEFLKNYLLENPGAQDVRLGYARGLVAEKRYEEARIEFRRLLLANPDNPEMIYAVGILSLQVNDTVDAEQQLKRFIETGRGDPNPARFYLGQITEQAGRVDEAVQWYDQVVAGEHTVPAKVRAAQILLRQNKFDEARQRIAAARENAPGDVRLVVAESQLLRDAGRHAEAYAFLVQALEAQSDQPDLLYETALAAEKLGHLDVLERHLRRLIELQPDSPQAYNALGYSLADRNLRLEEAAQLIDKALALTPDDPFILDSKGWVLFRQGKNTAALDALQKAYAKRPDAEIAAHLGEVLWSLGRRDEALKIWREATQTHPTNEALAATVKRFAP